ncbi:MAG: hypothetical protein MJD61_13615, partial [Proteobacteria bacterium]|nr:hypothetical protein [Pseudomonadota bacterium]
LGLVNMKGRIYDAHMGRFLTPDPFVPEPGNSQSWNRYSYVVNNPLNWTDPSGFTECPTDYTFAPSLGYYSCIWNGNTHDPNIEEITVTGRSGGTPAYWGAHYLGFGGGSLWDAPILGSAGATGSGSAGGPDSFQPAANTKDNAKLKQKLKSLGLDPSKLPATVPPRPIKGPGEHFQNPNSLLKSLLDAIAAMRNHQGFGKPGIELTSQIRDHFKGTYYERIGAHADFADPSATIRIHSDTLLTIHSHPPGPRRISQRDRASASESGILGVVVHPRGPAQIYGVFDGTLQTLDVEPHRRRRRR